MFGYSSGYLNLCIPFLRFWCFYSDYLNYTNENVTVLISVQFNAFRVLFLQQALVGEVSGEEQLFSSEGSSSKDGIDCGSELDSSLQKLKVVMVSLSLSLVGTNGKVMTSDGLN